MSDNKLFTFKNENKLVYDNRIDCKKDKQVVEYINDISNYINNRISDITNSNNEELDDITDNKYEKCIYLFGKKAAYYDVFNYLKTLLKEE